MTSIVTPSHPKLPHSPQLRCSGDRAVRAAQCPGNLLWPSPVVGDSPRSQRMGSCRAHGTSEKLGATKGVYGGKAARSSRKAPEDELAASCRGRTMFRAPRIPPLALAGAQISTSWKLVIFLVGCSVGKARESEIFPMRDPHGAIPAGTLSCDHHAQVSTPRSSRVNQAF